MPVRGLLCAALGLSLAACIDATPIKGRATTLTNACTNPPCSVTNPDTGETCTDACSDEDAHRCNGNDVEQCVRAGTGCLAWQLETTCSGNRLCCGAACVVIDESNCYACGVGCGGERPLCSAVAGACSCRPSDCWTPGVARGCDAASGQCQACVALTSFADIYVDPENPNPGTGTEPCPFRTVSEALAVAEDGSTVHIAAGTYDSALGEMFPLRLRKAVRLVGAGEDVTVISGAATFDLADHNGHYGDFGASRATTLWINREDPGDDLPVRIESLTLRLPTGDPTSVGLLCDRGNAAAVARPAVAPPPSLIVDSVHFGPGYGLAAAIVHGANFSSGVAQGCNALFQRSTFSDIAEGIWAAGAGQGVNGHFVGLTLGGDAAATNHFASLDTPDVAGGCDVRIWDGVSPVVVTFNEFLSGEMAVCAVQHQIPPGTPENRVTSRFEDNVFNGLSRAGLRFDLAWIADTVLRNTFTNIDGETDAAAIFLGRQTPPSGGGAGANARPRMLVARGNSIVGNRRGVAYEQFSDASAPTPDEPAHYDALGPDDWSAQATNDAGPNVIACNSELSSGPVTPAPDGDIHFAYGFSTLRLLPAVVKLSDNTFDHAPPTVDTQEGSDVVYAPAAVDYQTPLNITVYSSACPAGRTAGP